MKVQLISLQFSLADDLHQCKQTNEGDSKVKTQIQTGNTEGKTVVAGHRVCTNTRNDQTEAGSDDALDETFARNACDDGHAEQTDHEVLGCTKLRRDFGDLGSEKEQHQCGKDAAEGGGIERDFKSRLGAAHLGQRMTVQHGSCRVGRARGVDKDSRHRAAVSTRTVNAQQEHHARNRTHGISDR